MHTKGFHVFTLHNHISIEYTPSLLLLKTIKIYNISIFSFFLNVYTDVQQHKKEGWRGKRIKARFINQVIPLTVMLPKLQSGNLFRVYPTSYPTYAGTGSLQDSENNTTISINMVRIQVVAFVSFEVVLPAFVQQRELLLCTTI